MELTGSRMIHAPREEVWRALNDPEVLKACIPGVTDLTGNVGDGMEAVATQKVGPVKATFKGAVSFSNIEEGQGYTISGEGKGGAAGHAKGSADVKLKETDEGTELDYTVEAAVGGKLAQLGSRIIDGFAKKMADKFFENFKMEVEGENYVPTDSGEKKGLMTKVFGKKDKDEETEAKT